MSDDNVVLIEVADRVAVVTLHRPEARNALDPALTAALPEAIAACDARDDVDAIVLTGADPAFCAGVDLKSLSSDREVRHVVASDPDALIRPFPETRKPVIAQSTVRPSPAASRSRSRATSSSRPSVPASPTPMRASGSCRDGGSQCCWPRRSDTDGRGR